MALSCSSRASLGAIRARRTKTPFGEATVRGAAIRSFPPAHLRGMTPAQPIPGLKTMDKTFDAKAAEPRIYAKWEAEGCFAAGANASRDETFAS